jgi:hypothetical protein
MSSPCPETLQATLRPPDDRSAQQPEPNIAAYKSKMKRKNQLVRVHLEMREKKHLDRLTSPTRPECLSSIPPLIPGGRK